MGGDDVDDEGKECDSDGVQRQLQHQNQAPQQQQKQQNQRVPRLEGCHEITSAKQRLTTAETWNESTSEAVKSAQGQLESAQVQFQASRNEVEDAKSCLIEVFNRWVAVDVGERQQQHQAPQQQQQNQGMSRIEGCHNIALAKQRLTTAETWNKYTIDAVESAQRQLELAQAQFQASRNEVDEAESALNEVCKKWEVIDVDEEGGMCESDRQWWQ